MNYTGKSNAARLQVTKTAPNSYIYPSKPNGPGPRRAPASILAAFRRRRGHPHPPKRKIIYTHWLTKYFFPKIFRPPHYLTHLNIIRPQPGSFYCIHLPTELPCIVVFDIMYGLCIVRNPTIHSYLSHNIYDMKIMYSMYSILYNCIGEK